jgi:hypothetical protein
MSDPHLKDWVGNNAAFSCPGCKRIFIVSWMLHRSGRPCPDCKEWVGVVSKDGDGKPDAFARIEQARG